MGAQINDVEHRRPGGFLIRREISNRGFRPRNRTLIHVVGEISGRVLRQDCRSGAGTQKNCSNPEKNCLLY